MAPLARANGIWQWNSPWAGTPKEMPVDEVYFRAATISFAGDNYVAILPGQVAKPAKGNQAKPIHLVLNFDGGAVRHFEEVSPVEIASSLGKVFRAGRDRAVRGGAKVVGIQLDFDCPTRLLPRYAEMVRALRKDLPKGIQVSITGLTSWIGDDRLKPLWESVDVFVPQFYEGRLPKDFQEDVPVSDAGAIERSVSRLKKTERPFRIGIAAYGQAILYGADGHLFGIYRGLSLADAFRHPSLRCLGMRIVRGEKHVRFIATRADGQGRGKGFGILYRIPTAESFQQALSTVNGIKSHYYAGYVIYRLPEPGESQTLSAIAQVEVLHGRTPKADIGLDFTKSTSPFAMIEGAGKGLAEEVSVAIRNRGSAAWLSNQPLTVDVQFPAGCGETVTSSFADRMDRTVRGRVENQVSLARSDGVRFTRWLVGAGEKVELGEVRLQPGCRATVVLGDH